MKIVETLALMVAGAAIILAVAFIFLTASIPHAQAASCSTMRASYYGAESGNRTANDERFDGSSMTAAHRTLPFGTKLRVTYRGKSVVVRINDRGPYIKGRQLDLSRAAAARIGLIPAGVATVTACRI